MLPVAVSSGSKQIRGVLEMQEAWRGAGGAVIDVDFFQLWSWQR